MPNRGTRGSARTLAFPTVRRLCKCLHLQEFSCQKSHLNYNTRETQNWARASCPTTFVSRDYEGCATSVNRTRLDMEKYRLQRTMKRTGLAIFGSIVPSA